MSNDLEEIKPQLTDEEFVEYAKEIKKNLNKVIRDIGNWDALDDLGSLFDLTFFQAECSRRYFTELFEASRRRQENVQ